MVKTGGKYLQGIDLHLILQTEFNQFSSDNSKPFDNQHKNKWGRFNSQNKRPKKPLEKCFLRTYRKKKRLFHLLKQPLFSSNASPQTSRF
jgi:hypothetical protein